MPVSDEAPCRGSTEGEICSATIGSGDRGSIDNAIALANQNSVFVFPITGAIEDAGDETCIRFLADLLADGTGAQNEAFHVDDFPVPATAYEEIGDLLVQALSGIVSGCAPSTCAADINGDCFVDVLDLLVLLGQFSPELMPCNADCCAPGCSGDIDGDCVVGVLDLLALLGEWSIPGSTCDVCCGAGCAGQMFAGGAGPTSGTMDLKMALNEIGFADLAQYGAWALGASNAEVFESAVLLSAVVSKPME